MNNMNNKNISRQFYSSIMITKINKHKISNNMNNNNKINSNNHNNSINHKMIQVNNNIKINKNSNKIKIHINRRKIQDMYPYNQIEFYIFCVYLFNILEFIFINLL